MKLIKRLLVCLCCFSLFLSFFGFSVNAASKPFYVFDLSNLDAVGFQFKADDNTNVTYVKQYTSDGYILFQVYGTDQNNISGVNSVFNFSLAGAEGSSRVFLQQGVSYSFNIHAWNSFKETTDGIWHRANFINSVTLSLQNASGVVVTVKLNKSDISVSSVAGPASVGNVNELKFSLDGSIYPGYELIGVSFVAETVGDGFSSVYLVSQCFSSFTISALTDNQQLGDKIDDQTEKQKGFFEKLGDHIGGFFEDLLSGILDGLKSLFIPGDVVDPETGETVGYFTLYFDEWDDWMNEHFGVLYFPFTILFDVLDRVITFDPPENPTITFPGLTIMDQVILEPMEYDFTTIDVPFLNTMHELYLFAVDAIIGFWLVKLAYKKITEIMGNG